MFQKKLFYESYNELKFRKNGFVGEIETVDVLYNRYCGDDYSLLVLDKVLDNNRRIYFTNDNESKMYLSFMNKFLKSKNITHHSSRNVSIQKLLNFLCIKDYSFNVIKLDFKDFYNSIQHDHLKKIIKLNPKVYEIEFQVLFDKYLKCSNMEKSVLPGLSPSNILAEIYACECDKYIQNFIRIKNWKIIYYDRYVDDILIFVQSDDNSGIIEDQDFVQDLNHKITNDLNIQLNTDKSIMCSTKTFEFLGYKFIYDDNWHIDIAKSKADKIIKQIDSLRNWYDNSELATEKKYQVFWEKYCYLTKVKIFRKNGSFFSTGYAENYKYLSNSFKVTVPEESNCSSINYSLNTLRGYVSQQTQKKAFQPLKDYRGKFDFISIIEDYKKILFIDNKDNFNKRRVKRKLKVHFDYASEDLYNLKYYELCELYISEIKKDS